MPWTHFFLHLHVAKRDVQGHVTLSLQVKMVRYVWTEEEIEHFLQVIKKKNITASLDSEQTNLRHTRYYKNLMEMPANFNCTSLNFFKNCFYFATNFKGNADNWCVFFVFVH